MKSAVLCTWAMCVATGLVAAELAPDQRLAVLQQAATQTAALDARLALENRTAQLDAARALAIASTDLALASPSGLASVLASGQEQAIWLAVVLNGHTLDELVEVLQPAGKSKAGLRITREQWQAMGLIATESEFAQQGVLALDDLIDIAYRYDVPSQRVFLKVPVSRFAASRIDVSAAGRTPNPDPVGYSAVLNYDAFVQYQRPDDGSDASSILSGLLDGRVATPIGNFYQSATVQGSDASVGNADSRRGLQRLDTSYRYFDQGRLMSWQVGDAISRGLNTRPAVRFAGVQWQRNFSLRPDLLTIPTAQFSGSAAVPTTIDVLIDQVQRSRVQVPAGPFTLDQLPVLTGPHQVQVIVRDALGRDQVTVLDLFSAPQLLAPGLLDFAVQSGVQRRNYNGVDDRYDSAAFFIGSTRYGLSPEFTVEGQLELEEGVQVGSAGFTTVVGSRATVAVNTSASQSDVGAGLETTLRTDLYVTPNFYVQGSITLTDDLFRDISTLDEVTTRNRHREQLSMNYGFDSGRNLGLSYVAQSSSDGSEFSSVFLTASQTFWQQGYASATLSRSLDDADDTSFSLGLSWYLDNRISLNARHDINPIGTSRVLSAQSTIPQDLGWGWQVEAADGVRDYQRASLQNRNRYSDLNAMLENNDAGQIGRFSANGSVAWLPGATLATRRIDDAFALIDLGYANVPVFNENRPIGQTDANGLLMVPSLNAYLNNKLSIAASELPFDVDIDNAARVVVPTRDAGIRVGFATRRDDRTLVALRLPSGIAMAVGSRLQLPDGDQQVIGHDGLILLTPALAGASLSVLTDTQRCTLQVPASLLPDAQRAIVLEVICPE